MISKAVVVLAKKSAQMDANTACAFMNFQPKIPKAVQKLRKF